MTELPLLINVAVALAYALAGGWLARRVGLPTIVGYLVAGVALGPFTPGFRGDADALGQLAEFGVILLMFGVGLHFSFRDLWRVRAIAIPGALIQMGVVTAVGAALGRAWGYSAGGSFVLGVAVSVASTVVLMRTLMDRGWLDTPAGKVATGWLVFEDLLTVGILVLLPAVASTGSSPAWITGGVAAGKALAFVGLMMLVGRYLMPAVLGRVVSTRSRELFVLAALTVAVGVALAASAVFDVSLALGAFVAGVVVSDSPFSHQIGADLLPFREAFAVIFFVSIGMLVNPHYLVDHWRQVLVLTAVIVVFKAVVSGLLGAVLPGSSRTAFVLAAGRSQIGEFSFVIGQTGLSLGLIDGSQYSLILAGAIVSITLNAFVFRLVDPAERALRRSPRLWRAVNRSEIALDPAASALDKHVIIVGCGRVGRHIVEVLGRLQIPRLVVEVDPAKRARLRELGVPVLYGDASSSEILEHAGLDRARALVITLPDDASALAVAATAHRRAPDLQVVARAATWDGAQRLKAVGVGRVVRPELEGGVEIVRHTLLDLELPFGDVQRYADLVRHEGLEETDRPSVDRSRILDDLRAAAGSLEVIWIDVDRSSAFAGRTIGAARLRTRTGASVVGIAHDGRLEVNPGPDQVLHPGGRVAIIGTARQVRAVEEMLGPATPGS